MKQLIFRFLPLILLISFAIFVRSYRLNTLPPSLFADEIDAGYQAENFLKYGTDYFANRFPLHFHSFSDWRTSLQIYSIALVESLHINREISVRLPSVIFGVASCLVFFLITRSYPSLFLLTISPWAIHYSRTGFEVSGMLFCLLAGIYFWQKYHNSPRPIYLVLSVLALSLSPYFYSTAKLFIVFVFPLLYFTWPLQKRRHIILLFLTTFLFLLPLGIDTLRGKAGYRFSYISIFTEPHREQTTDTLRYQDILLDHPNEVGVSTPFSSFIFHNKYQLVLQRFITNYFSAFSSDFLALSGDKNLRQGFGQHGLIYFLDFFMVIIGIYYSLKQRGELGKFFLWWLILSPLPFALTRDSSGGHATRLILILPSLIYFASIALSRCKWITPIYLLLFINFWHYYHLHYPQDSAASWHSNLKEAVLATNSLKSDTPVFFSDKVEPFLPFFVYYRSYFSSKGLPPHLSFYSSNFFTGKCLDNHYCFGTIEVQNIPPSTTAAFVLTDQDPPPSKLTLKTTINHRYATDHSFYLYTNEP